MTQNVGMELGSFFSASLSPPIKGSLGSGGVRAGIVTHAPAGHTTSVYVPLGGLENVPPPRPSGDNRHSFMPNGALGWNDGGGIVLPQYRAHKETKVYDAPVQLWHWRTDPEPYNLQYPPKRRTLLPKQVPQKYIIGNTLVASTVYSPQNYFLGYAPSGSMG